MPTPPTAHPPATLEGWYALHQIFRVESGSVTKGRLDALVKAARVALGDAPTSQGKAKKRDVRSHGAGWSCIVKLIGSASDLMIVHFRESFDAIRAAQDVVGGTGLAKLLVPTYSFLSVTEAGLYHLTADLARQAVARGGTVGDELYVQAQADRSAADADSAHVRRRLYPERPADMP